MKIGSEFGFEQRRVAAVTDQNAGWTKTGRSGEHHRSVASDGCCSHVHRIPHPPGWEPRHTHQNQGLTGAPEAGPSFCRFPRRSAGHSATGNRQNIFAFQRCLLRLLPFWIYGASACLNMLVLSDVSLSARLFSGGQSAERAVPMGIPRVSICGHTAQHPPPPPPSPHGSRGASLPSLFLVAWMPSPRGGGACLPFWKFWVPSAESPSPPPPRWG